MNAPPKMEPAQGGDLEPGKAKTTQHSSHQNSTGSADKGTGAPADSDLRELYVRALKPITDRVRRDVTAIKLPSGTPWTDETLTKARLLAHLFEDKPRGCCPIKAGESTTLLGLLDLDSHKGETSWPDMASAAVAVMSELRRRGAAPIPFRSSGGRGIHIFVLYEKPQDAHSVRVFLDEAIRAVGYKNGAVGVKNRLMEIFPKQPTVEVGRYGNQFILPLAKQSVPLDPATCDPLSRDAVLTMQWPMSPAVPFVENATQVREASSVGADPGMAGRALLTIPNDGSFQQLDDRAAWFKLLCAFKEAAGEEGYTIANDWSAQHGSHVQEKFDKAWDSIQIGRENGAPAEYLYSVAGQFGFVEHISGGFDDIAEQDMVEARRAIADITECMSLVESGEVVLAAVKVHLPAAGYSGDEYAALLARLAGAVDMDQARVAKAVPPPPRSRFASTSFDVILDPQPVEWLIKGVLPHLDIGMMFGASGSGKSFLILDMAAAIVRGVPWRGYRVKRGEVAYIAAEGARGFRQRVQAYIKHYGAEAGAALREGFRIHEIAPNLMEKDDATELATVLKREGAPMLVVVDTLAQVTPGGDENNSKDMKTALRLARNIGRATGAMVVVVHHSGKDASKGARGWSGLKGDMDVELEVTRAGDDRVLTVSKLKEGREGDKYGFKLLDVPLGMDDGEVYGSCVVEHGPVAAKAPARGKGKWQKRVDAALDDLAGLDDRLVPQTQVEDRVLEIALENDEDAVAGKALANRIHSVRSAIDSMVEDKTLVQKGTFIGRGRGES